MNVPVKLFKVDSKLWDSVVDSVSVYQLFKLMIINYFKSALRIYKVEYNLFKL